MIKAVFSKGMKMDPIVCRTISHIIVLVGSGLALFGGIGTCYFGNIAEKIAPFRQSISTASTTVEITIASDEKLDTHYIDRGGYLALLKGSDHLLLLSSSDCWARQIGQNKVVYRGIFNMDANYKAVGKPVFSLREANAAIICFLPMPKEADILDGKAACIINGNVRFEIKIPAQKARESKVLVSNLNEAFSDFK